MANVKNPLHGESNENQEMLQNALGRQFFREYSIPKVTLLASGDVEAPEASYDRNFRIDATRGIAKSLQKVIEAMPTAAMTEGLLSKIRAHSSDEYLEIAQQPTHDLSSLFFKAAAHYCGVKIDKLGIDLPNEDKTNSSQSNEIKQANQPPRITRPHLDRLEFTRDWLNGLHADENLFQSAYCVRGIQYGNWLLGKTTDSEAQQVLNTAFNAMADLADILKLPPQTLSFGGYLGMAFASRGKRGAAAHYEPGSSKVINLTRYQGGGALAHELGHAFSHFVARIGDASDMRGLGHQLERSRANWNPIAKDLAHFIEHLSSHEYDYLDRSKKIDKLEQRKKPYWSTPEEMFARFFEAYTELKLINAGIRSDYLVHSTQTAQGYPSHDELIKMSEKFDKYLENYRSKIVEHGMPKDIIKANARDNTQSYGYEN